MECWIFWQGAWAGILHHAVNEHEWLMSYDNDTTHTKCQHGPFPEDRNKNYLEKGSDALMALTNIVMDKRLLNNTPYYLNCRYDSFACYFISWVHQVSFVNSFGVSKLKSIWSTVIEFFMVTHSGIASGEVPVWMIKASIMESIAPTKILNQRCLGAPTNITETSAVSQDVLIKKKMTKLTGGSGHITDLLRSRTANKPAFGWKWSVGVIWEPKSQD